ncbi:hypothetical protein CBOM_05663 [Ceraceosorus bombacis]|uniref:Uncharacterized protein n=1 Tax=Ceraceosorus bombacis TaxID=401625 RepID=A0A0P1BRY8_9BASI|nr:hypothetical protein CBOM_05663 [Ceraceosorus bombacis]
MSFDIDVGGLSRMKVSKTFFYTGQRTSLRHAALVPVWQVESRQHPLETTKIKAELPCNGAPEGIGLNDQRRA